MAARIARKPVGFLGRCSHGIDVTGNQASFRKGSRDQRRTPCQARAGMTPRIARTRVGFLDRCSHGIDVTGNQACFWQGWRDQRPASCEARAGMSPRIARKPVGFLCRCSHGIGVTGNRAPFRKESSDRRPIPCQGRAGMSPRIARKPAGFVGRCSHGIWERLWGYLGEILGRSWGHAGKMSARCRGDVEGNQGDLGEISERPSGPVGDMGGGAGCERWGDEAGGQMGHVRSRRPGLLSSLGLQIRRSSPTECSVLHSFIYLPTCLSLRPPSHRPPPNLSNLPVRLTQERTYPTTFPIP